MQIFGKYNQSQRRSSLSLQFANPAKCSELYSLATKRRSPLVREGVYDCFKLKGQSTGKHSRTVFSWWLEGAVENSQCEGQQGILFLCKSNCTSLQQASASVIRKTRLTPGVIHEVYLLPVCIPGQISPPVLLQIFILFEGEDYSR